MGGTKVHSAISARRFSNSGSGRGIEMIFTGKMFVLFVVVVVLICDSLSIVESVPAPSSAWYQPMLTIATNTKSRVGNSNNNNDNESSSNKTSENKRSSSDNSDGYKNGKTGSAWVWLLNQKDDNGKIQPHIRHYSKKLKAVTKLPCQAGHNRGYDGKCRQIPRFSMSRVG